MLVTSKKKYRKGRTREDRAAGWFGRSSSAGGRRRKMLRRMRARRRAVADLVDVFVAKMRPNRVGVDLVRNTGRTIKLKTELFERSYN